MTNETTASQPKSIGDDAQFSVLLTELCLAPRDQKVEIAAKMIACIDNFYAPAAQASATIQAAPNLLNLKKYKQTWDSTSQLIERKDGDYYKVSDVQALLAAPMVADPAGVLDMWVVERMPGSIAIRNAAGNYVATAEGNDAESIVRAHNNALAATVKAVPSEALAAIHGLIAVAGAAYNLMDNTEESGPVGASVFKHQEDDNTYLNEALDQLDALPDDQPGYVMGPCAKAEWALRHILARSTGRQDRRGRVMAGVTVSISLTRAQQGELYMQNMRRGERIKHFRAGLKEIIKLADASGQTEVSAMAAALLVVPKEPTA